MKGVTIAFCNCICPLKKGGIAQLARASALQAEGHRFESVYLHSFPFSSVYRHRAGCLVGSEAKGIQEFIDILEKE